jgi:predicted nuclease of predicted toxin-antitoxin system
MYKFIIDTQLPPVLAKFLAREGYDVVHTSDYPNGHLLSDSEIRKISISESRIIITKDSDFFEAYLLRGAPPRVLYLQLGNIKNKELIQLLNNNLQTILHKFETGSDLVQLTRNQITAY